VVKKFYTTMILYELLLKVVFLNYIILKKSKTNPQTIHCIPHVYRHDELQI